MPRRWIYRAKDTFPHAEEWGAELSVSPLIVDILAARGLSSLGEMDRFLTPGLRHLPQPDCIPGMARASEVLAEALVQCRESGKRPAIWGDYDVDGVTATALMTDFLRHWNFDPLHHLPSRSEEGYGLNVEGVEALAGQGAGILVTVDCGITDHEAVARARELGLTVVVTDHHLPGETLPPADAVVDPRLAEPGADNPCADLAGVGVAFYLAAALNRLLPGEPMDMKGLLDLVALGTVADVVPLTGPNRILVKNGLLVIKQAARPGIAALKEVAGFEREAELGAGNIAFGLAPRINAAGRLGDADLALSMLLAPDLDAALVPARKLDAMNQERRAEEEAIQGEAMDQAREQAEAGRVALVLHAPHWHPGVIGIVASRVVEEFYRPTLMLCHKDGLIKGSGRSVEEFDLHAGLTAVADLLASYGGHRQAAGLSLEPDRLEDLREAFDEHVRTELGPKPLMARLNLDRTLDLGLVDQTLVREMELLAPFGMGNPEPVFASPPLTVLARKVFGKNHVRLTLKDNKAGVTMTGKAWRMAEKLGPEVRGQTVRVAFCPRIDSWNGVERMELHVRDWNLVETA